MYYSNNQLISGVGILLYQMYMLQNLQKFIQRHFNTKNQEFSQAFVRVVLMVIFLVYLFLYYHFQPEKKLNIPFLTAVMIYFVYCLVLLLHVKVHPNFILLRHFFTIAFDMILIGIGMYAGGLIAAFFYGGYLWLILGNGVRFGQRSLYLTMVLSITSFILVIELSEFWQNNLEFGIGLLVWLVLLPPYIGRLIKQKDIAIERAQMADNAKSRFLTNMSHELRTPLNGIIGYSQMIYEDDEEIEEARNSAKKIDSAASHLLSLINELMDMASIEADKMKVVVEAVELDKLITDVMSLVEVLSEKRNIKLILDNNVTIRISADRLRLKQVLVNIISNAIKYNSEGGSVRISSDVDEDIVNIQICDDGPGLTEEEQQLIFNPFERLSETAATVEGAGIGLMITKKLIHLMGGEIGVESEKGFGSCFWIHLPIVKD